MEICRINQLMRHYCAEASIYGDRTQPANQPFPQVIVIFNPVADRKSAADTVCNLIPFNSMNHINEECLCFFRVYK